MMVTDHRVIVSTTNHRTTLRIKSHSARAR
jgi:hypothetical protein